jgi:asparagine synthase (glutamine-hydrolysing)
VSGIAGAVFLDGREVGDALLARMIEHTPHRGFDGTAAWHAGPAGLIRFAHATVPEAVGEKQPFVHPPTGIAMVFDGRIDNREELLPPSGVPAGAPDGDIALALFERFGDGFVARLVGDYTLAAWQPAARRLFVARSAGSWRRLLWTCHGNMFAFATEPRTLVDGLQLPRRLNEGAIGEFLAARFLTETETFWEGVQRLPQGSALSLENGRVRTWLWHRGPFEDWTDRTEAEHVERLRAAFDQALFSATRSSTAVAAQLSGGLDSSSVVCRATQLHRSGRIERQVMPVTVRFPGDSQDESEWSREVERYLQLPALVVAPRAYDLGVAQSWCAETLHLPLRPNALNTLAGMCERLRADGVRVLLTGEGGDDWLSGSRAHWPDLLASGRWPRLMREARDLMPQASLAGRARALAMEAAGPLLSRRLRERLFRPFVDFGTHLPPWVSPDWARRAGLAQRWRSDPLPLRLPTYAQQNRYPVYSLGRRHINMDNALAFAAGHGVELRHPFHDLRVTRFVMGADGGVLRRGGVRKALLREAMRGVLPEKIRTRPDKADFTGGIVDAVTAYVREHPVERWHCARLGWIDAAEVRRSAEVFARWRAAGSPPPAPREHVLSVWAPLALHLWLEHAFRL